MQAALWAGHRREIQRGGALNTPSGSGSPAGRAAGGGAPTSNVSQDGGLPEGVEGGEGGRGETGDDAFGQELSGDGAEGDSPHAVPAGDQDVG